jgi:hypothetical protein
MSNSHSTVFKSITSWYRANMCSICRRACVAGHHERQYGSHGQRLRLPLGSRVLAGASTWQFGCCQTAKLKRAQRDSAAVTLPHPHRQLLRLERPRHPITWDNHDMHQSADLAIPDPAYRSLGLLSGIKCGRLACNQLWLALLRVQGESGTCSGLSKMT